MAPITPKRKVGYPHNQVVLGDSAGKGGSYQLMISTIKCHHRFPADLEGVEMIEGSTNAESIFQTLGNMVFFLFFSLTFLFSPFPAVEIQSQTYKFDEIPGEFFRELDKAWLLRYFFHPTLRCNL